MGNPTASIADPKLPSNPAPSQNPYGQVNPNQFGANQVTNQNVVESLFPPVEKSVLPQIIGDSGTMRYGGFFLEEYNNQWSDQFGRVDLVEEMRRSDATVSQLLKAITNHTSNISF